MRDRETGIEVSIHHPKTSAKPTYVFAELDAPYNSGFSTAYDRNECFLEVGDGGKYAFGVRVPSKFNWMGARGLLLTFNIDDGATKNIEVWKKNDISCSTMYKYCRVHEVRNNTKHFCDYEFPTRCTIGDTLTKIPGHHTIEVTIQRISGVEKATKTRGQPLDNTSHSAFPASEVPKERRSSPVQYYERGSTADWKPASNEAGQKVKFTFIYQELSNAYGIAPHVTAAIEKANVTHDFLDILPRSVSGTKRARADAEANSRPAPKRQRTRVSKDPSPAAANSRPAAKRQGTRVSKEPSPAAANNRPAAKEQRTRASKEPSPAAGPSAPGLKSKQYWTAQEDQDDEELPLQRQVKVEVESKLRLVHPAAPPSTVSLRRSLGGGSMGRNLPESEEEEVEIVARLEEIRLERRLRELRARKN